MYGVAGSNTSENIIKDLAGLWGFAAKTAEHDTTMGVLVSNYGENWHERSRPMKRYGNLWPLICDRRNLELAASNAIAGKRITSDMQKFINNRLSMMDALEASMRSETYRLGPLKGMAVYEPKERIINYPGFYPDRIIEGAAVNVVGPLFLNKFTADTYGSIKGRGIIPAAKKLAKAMKEHPDWYFVQIDIRKFYPSCDHEVLKGLIRRVIKCPPTLRLLDAIIDAHSPGLAIGVWPSQYFANLMLTPVDHWAKETARIKYYFRYMDDIVYLTPDKATAHALLNEITEQCQRLKLTVKPSSRIAPVTYGIDYMGYKFYPTHVRLRKRIKQRMKRVINRLRKQGASDEVFKRKTASYFGWCKHANCRHLLKSAFQDKITLYAKNMEIKRLSELRNAGNWFDLTKDKRVSIESLYGKEIIFYEFLTATIKKEPKIVVKFAYPDSPEAFRYFITRSDVVRDRLERDRDVMPFIATINKVKNYIAYE